MIPSDTVVDKKIRSTQVNFRIYADERKALKLEAATRGITFAELLREKLGLKKVDKDGIIKQGELK